MLCEVLAYPLVVTGDHHPHREPHPLVVVANVGEKLRGGGHGYPLPIPELVEPALFRQHTLPVGTISRTSRHRPKEELVDGNDLFDCARADVSATGRPRVAG